MALANKTMIILVATSVLGSVGAAVGTGILLRGKTPPAAADKHEEPAKSNHKEAQTVHALGELVVNLADRGEELRYAKISVAVGYEEKVPEEEIKAYDPVLRDAVITTVSKLSFNDLHKINGLDLLKKSLFEGMKDRVPKVHLAEIYIEGFAMQ